MRRRHHQKDALIRVTALRLSSVREWSPITRDGGVSVFGGGATLRLRGGGGGGGGLVLFPKKKK